MDPQSVAFAAELVLLGLALLLIGLRAVVLYAPETILGPARPDDGGGSPASDPTSTSAP